MFLLSHLVVKLYSGDTGGKIARRLDEKKLITYHSSLADKMSSPYEGKYFESI